MGMCRKVEDAVGRSRANLYKASLFDNGRDEARRVVIAGDAMLLGEVVVAAAHHVFIARANLQLFMASTRFFTVGC